MGDRIRHSVLRREAANTNITDATATKSAASVCDIAPRGSSRMDVRGFIASNRASTRRLNPIAALRALTMQTTIQSTCRQEKGCSRQASSAPVSANGSANTEWLNLTNDKYARTLLM